MKVAQLNEMYNILQQVILTLENNAVMHRKFNGLICLSNPEFDLYKERPDPTVVKNITEESEKWGHLLDCLFRYFDGETTILDIATKHDLPFEDLRRYIARFEEKNLISLSFHEISKSKAKRV